MAHHLRRFRRFQQSDASRYSRNSAANARNDALDAEVRDLKLRQDALEERARLELGMIRKDEVFYQVVTPDAKAAPGR